MTGRLAVRVLVGVMAFVLTGCSAGPPTRTEPSTVEHPPAEVPVDRDRAAVIAALRELDLCAVLESVAPDGTDVEASTSRPFSCALRVGEEFYALRVQVEKFDSTDRLHLPVRDLGGAKAYVGDLADECQVSLPVSFRVAIVFHVRGECGPAQEMAADAAAVLANPDPVRRDAVWDACGAMVAAVEDDDQVVTSDGVLESCADKSGTQFQLTYGKPASPREDKWESGVVDGVTVWTAGDDANGCRSEWSSGTAPEQDRGDQIVAAVWALDCESVADLVAELVPVLKEPPQRVAPQRPLLYRFDEPDSPRVGACAYVEDEPCEPYVEVPVPTGQAEIVRAAEADVNVKCAIAIEAVTTHFGAGMLAVTVPDDRLTKCVFVEPERSVQVEVNLWADPADRVTTGRPGHREIELAGHPGYLRSRNDELDYSLATSTRTDEPGTLRLDVIPGPLGGERLAPEIEDKAESVLTDILRKRFG